MRESSQGTPDRRLNPRTKLVEIAYIGMGPENGGLVLDVSDGGLSFHSVAPVQQAEKIQFLLSLRGHSRIEGTGEVVWTNDMKTICGLRFTSLSSGAREHISDWTNRSKIPAPIRERKIAPSPQPAPTAQPAVSVAQPQGTQTGDAPLVESGPDAGPVAAPVFALRPAFESPLTVPDAKSSTIWREPAFLWVVFVVLGSTVGFATYKYGVQVGRSQGISEVQRAASPAAAELPQATAPASAAPDPAPQAPAASEARAAVEAAPVPGVSKTVPAPTLVNASKKDETAATAAQIPSIEEKTLPSPDHVEQQLQAGQSELAAAQAYLNGANGNRDSAKAARLLWAAVGNGNAAAEALLADLYIRGDGVTKSCEQGRILLVAAIKGGNIEAQQKLRDLNASGCQQ